MANSDPVRQLMDLKDALDIFDWNAARSICQDTVDGLWTSGTSVQASVLEQMVKQVRRKRQFHLLEHFAQGLLLAGVTSPVVKLHYAQALIELGRFAAAEYLLRSMLSEPRGEFAYIEARGLIGRIFKQLYVEARGVGPSHCGQFITRAIAEYQDGYDATATKDPWHIINVIALTVRGQTDRIAALATTAPEALAERVLQDLERVDHARVEKAIVEGTPPPATPAFERATRVEALVALRRFDEALKEATRYVDADGTDAFELGSTERQLREVWNLDADPDPAAAQVLAIIRAKLLTRQGGEVSLSPDGAERAIDAALTLQAVHGEAGSVSLEWYATGLTSCKGVVQVQTRTKEGFGTGWLVDGSALNPAWAGKMMMVTNKHVISPAVNGQRYQPTPDRVALLPDEAIVHHQLSKMSMAISESDLRWTSPDVALDATVIELGNVPKGAKALTLSPVSVQMKKPPERVYLIGHPAGKGLEFSLQDNLMLDCDETRVHYRAPTLGGSSGSPVFDAHWNVIALHHGGGSAVRRLNGEGRYAANEGIAISALRKAITS